MIAELDKYYIDSIQVKDAWKLCDFIVSNEDKLKHYFPKTVAQNQTPTLSQDFCVAKVKQFQSKEEFLFLIKEKETHSLIGLVYIKKLDWVKKQGEFAYCIDYSFAGQKIISNSVRLLSEYAFNHLNLKTLQIIVFEENIASIKVASNNNFVWKRTLKNEFTPENKPSLDMELFELYNES
ncbi:GNAT family N-acetyltransferase [Confluentibacter lentus]|uniref:GNAT family N-acetyltransferase n=1 Tax=Confluentibacter lentus TaxID=1699412 RepID=UPI000C283407|nr:GNAT family protein [Confluentibacter lentus]